MRVAAIIPAAGRGKRLQRGIPKAFVPIHGKPLLVHTLKNLLRAFHFTEVLVLVDPAQTAKARRILARHGLGHVCVEAGGRTRADSVRRGLRALTGAPEWVLVHDAARPLISRAVVLRVLSGAKKTGAAICVTPVIATVKRLKNSGSAVSGTEDRGSLCLAQTPQVFRRELLLSRYARLGRRALSATDEAALFDRSPVTVRVVEGDARNIKVTTPDDLSLMKYLLRSF